MQTKALRKELNINSTTIEFKIIEERINISIRIANKEWFLP